jgi:hypothetical protein
MTIGLTWRRTARRIKRLKETVLAISPDYLESPDPPLFDALLFLSLCINDEEFINGCYQRNGGTIIGMSSHR